MGALRFVCVKAALGIRQLREIARTLWAHQSSCHFCQQPGVLKVIAGVCLGFAGNIDVF